MAKVNDQRDWPPKNKKKTNTNFVRNSLRTYRRRARGVGFTNGLCELSPSLRQAEETTELERIDSRQEGDT